MEPIVPMEWLSSHRDQIVLIDIRWYIDGRSGRESYESGHARGAVFIDLDQWLAGPPSPSKGRHPLPDASVFARGMAKHGVSNDSVVVAYDDAGGVIAARLVWMLRTTGHAAALLDGGLRAFQGDLEVGEGPAVAEGVFAAREWPASRLATIDDARSRSSVVLDARNRDRYEGGTDLVDPRSGHIPGAHSVPCRESLDADGRLKRPNELREIFKAAGVREGADVISYCGSGVTACHNLLTMEWIGLGSGRLFPGSWSQYSHAQGLPLAAGPQPG